LKRLNKRVSDTDNFKTLEELPFENSENSESEVSEPHYQEKKEEEK